MTKEEIFDVIILEGMFNAQSIAEVRKKNRTRRSTAPLDVNIASIVFKPELVK